MKFAKNKTMAITIALILMTSMFATFVILPTAKAVNWSLPSYPSYAFIAAGPNPIGLGQTLEIDMWLTTVNPQASGYYSGKWANFTLNIWTPDGLQTLGPYDSDSNAMDTIYYTPTTTGIYYFQFTFPGQQVTGKDSAGASINTWFEAATSQKISITVQQEPVPWFPEAPLPTEYWTRPINAINRKWESISGDWLMKDYNGQTPSNPYTTAPNSAHILWVQNTGIIGGLAGGVRGDLQYKVNQNTQAPITLAGRLYNNLNTPYGTQFTCTNLATGQLLWTQNGTVTIGMEYYYSLDGGVYPYLWSIGTSTWTMYDANTGGVILTLTGALPSGTSQAVMYDNKTGDLLCYTYSPNKWMALWNSSLAINLRSPPTNNPALNWLSGIQWNVTIPNLSITTLTLGGLLAAGGAKLWSPDVIIVTDQTTSTRADYRTLAAFSTKDGAQLWNESLPSHIAGTQGFSELGPGGGRMSNGILIAFNKATLQWCAFNYYTGAQLWETPTYNTSDSIVQMDNQFANALMANGVLYATYQSGYVRAFNLTNGQPLWVWNNEISGTQATEPYTSRGGSFTHATATLADGKLYVNTYYSHEPLPLPQTDALYCLNATTGTEIWNIGGYFGYYQQSTPISNGYIVSINAYDNQIYCFGKGPSATTVEAPMADITQGSGLVIRGTVTDISAGTTQTQQAADFPNGVPVVSDASMSAWMEYLYEQQSRPTNATGVPVSIDVVDSNGNYRNIGSTTSDSSGTFSFQWTPDIPGKYTVIATFAGSESYWPSSSETSFAVDAAAATPIPATPAPQSAADMYFVPAIAGLFVVIIIIGAVLALLMLRKRP